MAAQVASFDVAVYAATASGAIAAIAAAREGLRVALVEPGRHVGGMVSGGLGWTDAGDQRVIGGLALEFYERVAHYYEVETWSFVGPEPHVAERIFRDWLDEVGVTLFFDARLRGVVKDERRIVEILTEQGDRIAAAAFIDASYEGDLLARAGVSYAIGREPVERYGESWAGRRPILPGQHNFAVPVSPF
ncbi:MAG TPA: FAD-dependent oxidoreductase, partial [Ardenticatenaceae bacterium]|nr:FAD-dependent oxidoreductase [Ardenticatenaceae bacterium]